MNPPEVKIMGLQRSGNNWLNSLLKKNYYVKLSDSVTSGWKHDRYDPDILGREINLIIICKHPLCWLPSIWRYRGERVEVDFDRYIQQTPGEVEWWDELYRHWLDVKLKTRRKFIVQYEFLLQYTESTCKLIATFFGLQRLDTSFYNPRCRMTTKNSEGDQPFLPEYYQDQTYLSEYGESALHHVNSRIDWDVVRELGYLR